MQAYGKCDLTRLWKGSNGEVKLKSVNELKQQNISQRPIQVTFIILKSSFVLERL